MKKVFSLFIVLIVGNMLSVAQAQVPTSGLQLHLKADAGTSTSVSGQKISQWDDQSGNGNHAVQTNGTWQPTYINDSGTSVIRFNPAAPTSMNLPTHSELGIYDSEYEFFVVSRTSSQAAAQFVLAGGVNYGEVQVSGASGVRFISQFQNSIDNSERVDNGAFHVMNAIATTSNSELGVNGIYTTKSGDATHTIDVGFHLGTRGDGNYRLDGDIAEVLIYNRKLTDTESMQVTEYLKDKYSTPFTAYAAPGTPASNLTFSSVTQDAMTVNLTKGSGTHRLIIARRGSAVNAAPQNGTAYTGSATFGSGTEIGSGNYVVYAGTEGTSTAISNLTFDESYHYAVYEYYYVGGVPQYSSAVTGSQATSNLSPITNIQTSSQTGTSISGTLTKGSGTHRLIVARASGAVNQGPSNGVSYTGNTTFSSGSQIGSGNYVIYSGTEGTSFSLGSLSGNTVYHLALYEYTLVNGQPRYAIQGSPTYSEITYPNVSASGTQFSGVDLNQMTVSLTPGDGQKRIIIARESQPVSIGPSDDQSYTANAAFGNGQHLGSGNYVVYNGSGNSFTMTGLSNSTIYHFSVFEYNEFEGQINYKTSSPAVSSQSTTVVPLPVIATDADFGSGTATSREVTGAVNPSGFETTVEVLYGTDSGNLNLSTTPQSIGNGSADVPVTIDVTGLTTGQKYYAKLKATNPRGSVESSLTTLVPLTLSSMKGWFRADIALTYQSGAQVAIDDWTDLSGSGNDIIGRANEVYQSPNSINGKPAASFDPGAFRFKPSELDIHNSDLEMFIVFKSSNNNRQEMLYQSGLRNQLVLNDNSGIDINLKEIRDGDLTRGATGDFTDGNGYVLHYKSANNRFQLRMNNNAFTYKSGSNVFDDDNNYIYIGGNPYIGNVFDGEIAEILLYNSALSIDQRQEISQYLSSRYNVPVYEPSYPQTASDNIVFSNVAPTSVDVSFAKGDGDKRIIVARESGSQKTAPVRGTAYTANATFGSGSDLGNGNYVVYNGTANSVTVTGLSAETEYTIDVYEYNEIELDPQYMLTSPNSANVTTLAVTPPSIQLIGSESPGATSTTIQYLVDPNSDPTSVTVSYGTSSGSLGTTTPSQSVGNQSSDQLVSTTLSGLSAGTQYFYKVTANNNGGATESEIGTFVYQENISLASLQYWIAADDPGLNASSGDPITTWPNRAGKYLSATQNTSANRPQFVSDNGTDVIRFDGSNDFLNLPRADSLAINNSDYEMFVVARSSAKEVAFLLAGENEQFEIHLQKNPSTNGTRFIPTSSTYIDHPNNTTDGAFHIVNVTANDTLGAISVDGNTISSAVNARSASVESLVLGARKGGALPLDGDIAEVIIYNSDLTKEQRLQVEYYLAQKYGIDLPHYLVSSISDTNTGSGKSGTLRYVLNKINEASADSTSEVKFGVTGTITLSDDLPPINYNTTLIGPGKEKLLISGNDLHRPFFIGAGTSPFTAENPAAPDVTFKDFTITNGYGKGGNGYGASGGAAGMGGAIFVNDGSVIVDNIDVRNSRAEGGSGLDNNATGFGGGFGGDANGGAPGSSGYLGGVVPSAPGGNGGPGAGGYGSSLNGGDGGFGAGGARSSNSTDYGQSLFGGVGGFGGGGGASGVLTKPSGSDTHGAGGFGGGSGDNSGPYTRIGGGGAGMGGAIFNRFGSLFIKNSTFEQNTATGGPGGYNNRKAGVSYGGAIFNYQGQILTSEITYSSNSATNSSDFYDYNSGQSEFNVAEITSVDNVTGNSVTINGEITTLGYSGSYYVAYGTDPSSLSSATTTSNYSGENSISAVSVEVTGLDLSSMIYYKLVVTNDLGSFETEVRGVKNNTSIPSDSLKLWVSAGEGLLVNASKVEKWFDASGKSNNISQSNASIQPEFVSNVINGEPVVRFNGGSTYLVTKSTSEMGIQNADYELFVVAKSSDTNVQFLYSSGGEDYELQLNGSSGIRAIPESGKFIDIGSSGQFTDGQPQIIHTSYSDTDGAIRVNNELLGELSSNTRNCADKNILLGTRAGGQYYFNGDVAEMIIYNKQLTQSERLTVTDYLTTKYGVEKVVINEPVETASQPELLHRVSDSLKFNVHKGDGTYRIVVARQGSAPNQLPADNVVYTANSEYGSGSEIGTGNYVVYNGTDSTFTVTGLTAGTTYHFAVIEYNGTYETDYLTSSYLSYAATSLADTPTADAGSSLKFGGDDETVRVPHTQEFNFSTVTMEMWFKPDTDGSNFDFLTSKGNEENELHLGAEGQANTLRFIPTTQVYLDSESNVFTMGEWTHVAVVYDPANSLAKMYVNGEEVAITNNGSNPLSTPLIQSGSDFYLGSRAGSGLFYDGSMDEVRIWNSVRTAPQIREYMHKPVQSDYKNLVAYWQFNDASGSTLDDKITAQDGSLQNFEQNATNGWSDSTSIFGPAIYAEAHNVTSGSFDLETVNVSLIDDFDNAVTLNSTYLTKAPNTLPSNGIVQDSSFWLIKTIGEPGTYEATLAFDVPESFISQGAAAESQFTLYHRSLNSNGDWNVAKQGADSFTANSVTFSGISEAGQFLIGRSVSIDYEQSAGTAIKFDGVNDYISVSDNDLFDVDKYTLQMWFNWNEGANAVEFLMGKGEEEFEIHTNGSVNSLRFIPTPGVFIDSPENAFDSNTWTHLTVIYDPSQSLAKMYINGAEVTPSITGNLSTAIAHSSTPLAFGRRQSGQYYFNGQLDEIRIWNTVRTQAEIQQDMESTTPDGLTDGLIAYWQFNEGEGSTAAEPTYNLNGTLNNFDFNASSGWVESGASIQNNEEVQISLTGTQGWRLLASPVENSTFENMLSSLWTQGFPGAKYESGSANVFTWPNTSTTISNENWTPLTNITNNLPSGQGFLTYVFSDDDGPGGNEATGFPKTLTMQGIEPQGDQDLSNLLNSNNNGWALIGNPFKSAIDWDKISRTNLSNAVYVYDPSVAGWKSWNGLAGSLTDGGIGVMNAFFVQTLSANPTLVLSDTAKVSGGIDFVGKETQSEQNVPKVFSLELSGQNNHKNKAWFQFSAEADLGQDFGDALQLTPLDTEYVVLSSVLNDSVSLDINHLPLGISSYEIDLNMSSTATGTHKIELTDLQLPEEWTVELTENKTGETTDLSEPYTFEITTSTAKPTLKTKEGITPISLESSDNVRFTVRVTTGETVSNEDALMPKEFALGQNYPNPFNPSTTIRYQLPVAADVRLEVFNILGQKVATLVNESKSAGKHQAIFNAVNLSSGMYIYRITAGEFTATKQLVLIK